MSKYIQYNVAIILPFEKEAITSVAAAASAAIAVASEAVEAASSANVEIVHVKNPEGFLDSIDSRTVVSILC